MLLSKKEKHEAHEDQMARQKDNQFNGSQERLKNLNPMNRLRYFEHGHMENDETNAPSEQFRN